MAAVRPQHESMLGFPDPTQGNCEEFDSQRHAYVPITTQLSTITNIIKDVKWNQQSRDKYFLSLNKHCTVIDGITYPDLTFVSNFQQLFSVNPNYSLCKFPNMKTIGKGKIGTAHLININGTNYIIKQIYNASIDDYLSLRVIPFTKDQKTFDMLDSSFKYNSAQFQHSEQDRFRGFIVALGNNFSNQTCMHLIINKIIGNINSMRDNYVHQYDAFICKEQQNSSIGSNLLSIASFGDMSNYINNPENNVQITDNFISDIFKQLLNPLSVLKSKKYGFVHADLKCRNIFVNKTPDNRIVYQLADFDKSSIFWRGIRFHGKFDNSITDWTIMGDKMSEMVLYLAANPFVIQRFDDNGISYEFYQLGNAKLANVHAMFGHVSTHMSYDIYTFVVSLLSEPKVYKEYVSGHLQTFNKSLEHLFDHSDLDKILSYIGYSIKNAGDDKDKLKDIGSLHYVINILASLEIKLRKDINSFYNFNNVMSPSDYDTIINKYHETHSHSIPLYRITTQGYVLNNEYHICTSPCNKGQCKTNKYSGLGLFGTPKTYEYDNC